MGTANQKQSRVTQTLDGYGNVTQSKQYDFGLVEADARVYTNQYLTDANWTSRYIRNRLKVSTLTRGTYSLELARNYYDHEARPNCGSGASLQAIPGNNQRQHDSMTYTISYPYRGNAMSVTTASGPTVCMAYDVTGNVRWRSSTFGATQVTVTTQTNTNYAAPSQITANGYSTNMTWTSNLQMDVQSGPNGDAIDFNYDGLSRPASTTSPYGAVTTYTYSNTAPQVKATITVPVGQPVQAPRWTKRTRTGLGGR